MNQAVLSLSHFDAIATCGSQDVGDAELLILGTQFEAAWAARDELPDPITGDDDVQLRGAGKALDALAGRIIAMRAATLAGLRLKARVVAFCQTGEPLDWDFLGDNTDAQAAASIVRDLLAMVEASH